ncbi:Zinc-binding alcohol dehydrogenase domain-containing protein cipB [Lachnellula suecica]|uniref:Zinc-binding alcohol dehydrogenase domain-containing protein cipB n=1 Tax=Lachnellula suecica TaxID=602035 RepID=A0A8T9C6T5_9HELO|nr:Zinc-binding alcohol dehydrogenase domain-containing protein cipB [Lachnellula suecica]
MKFSMTTNTPAWLTVAKTTPSKIKPAPFGTPCSNQIRIENHAIDINQVDGKMQHDALFPLIHPTILGEDLAGEVIQHGPHVTRFMKGNRFATKREEENQFQEYTVLHVDMTAGFLAVWLMRAQRRCRWACLLLLEVFSARIFFHLELPTEPARKPTGKTLLVWGGPSSVRSNAIQLAIAGGYEVITSASPKNFEYCM